MLIRETFVLGEDEYTKPKMPHVFHMISGALDPVAPFSHAVESDGWVFITGQMPFIDTSTDTTYPEGIEAQTRAVMANLATVLAGCGLRAAG